MKFRKGDIVKIRNEVDLGRVVVPVLKDDGWWYEVDPVGLASWNVRRFMAEANLKDPDLQDLASAGVCHISFEQK